MHLRQSRSEISEILGPNIFQQYAYRLKRIHDSKYFFDYSNIVKLLSNDLAVFNNKNSGNRHQNISSRESELGNQIDNLKVEKGSLKKEIENLTAEKAQLKKEIENLTVENASLKNEIEVFHDSLNKVIEYENNSSVLSKNIIDENFKTNSNESNNDNLTVIKECEWQIEEKKDLKLQLYFSIP